MKFVMAIIKPHKLDPVREAVAELGITGMTVTEVKGYGRQGGHTEIYRGSEYEINYLPKLKVEIAVAADLADRVIDAIRETASEGKIGDGKIFVFDLQETIRVRTAETGEAAL